MVKVNDIVRFLNDVGGGTVTRVDGGTVSVVERMKTATLLLNTQKR